MILPHATGRITNRTWGHDELWRKGDITVDVPSTPALEEITIEYDDASRLARETLVGGSWDWSYEYDSTGNRTLKDDGSDPIDFTYSPGNRESGVDPGTEMEHDYKGNVVSRTPLAGGDPYLQEWDEYNRLRVVNREGQEEITYDYDSGVTLLRKKYGEDPALLTYFVGLNMIAAETGGDEREVVFPDSEEDDDPAVNGWWEANSGDEVSYHADGQRGRVARLERQTGEGVVIGDAVGGALNPNDADLDTANPRLQMWMRNDSAGNDPVTMAAIIKTTDDNQRLLWITTDAQIRGGEPA